MISDSIISYIIAGLAAAIPIAIWLYILFKQEKESRTYYFWSFIGGVLAVATLMSLQWFWKEHPEYDIFAILTDDIENIGLFFAATFIIVGILEEIAKQFLLRYLDTKKAVVRSINDSIKFSLVAALGFAFAENIFYLHSTYASYGGFSGVLLVTYIFRSVFTAAGHMCFSGIFGYYYGMARFATSLKQEAKLEGQKMYITRFVSEMFGMAESGLLQRKLIIQGLISAIVLHGTFNFILSLENIVDVSSQLPSILAMVLVGISFAYLYYLRKRQTGEVELLKDVTMKSGSEVSGQNEEIILELLAQWFQEKKYKDVITTADRFLEKNPNSTAAKVIKAKAQDALAGTSNVLDQTITTFIPDHEKKVEEKDKSVLDKYKTEKEKTLQGKVEIDKEKDDQIYHL